MRVGAAVAVGSAAVLVVAGAFFLRSRGAVEQPIAFNHSKHVQDLGLVCTTCHLYAETGTRATIPNIEVCQMCHAQPLTESPEEAVLVEHIQSGQPIRWRKVYWVPDHVYFSHRRHTSVAKIACETCHGAMGEMVAPVSRPMVKITMDRCLNCHKSEGASSDCISCHR
ncbi:MAG: cytochrome c3 family protein [Longimicrobiales bacterium]|nr:cytochrome c3 family protein [Longimicrobiales bacterium]